MAKASAELDEVEVELEGEGLHWERLDADLLVPELLRGADQRPKGRAPARRVTSSGAISRGQKQERAGLRRRIAAVRQNR